MTPKSAAWSSWCGRNQAGTDITSKFTRQLFILSPLFRYCATVLQMTQRAQQRTFFLKGARFASRSNPDKKVRFSRKVPSGMVVGREGQPAHKTRQGIHIWYPDSEGLAAYGYMFIFSDLYVHLFQN